MSRRKNDPRVVEILAAFDETLAIDAEDHRRRGTKRADFSEGSVDCFVHHAVIGNETFDQDWTDAALREIVSVFARHAPNERLDRMLASVQKEIVSNREAMVESAYEDATGLSYRARMTIDAAEAN